VTLQNGLYRCAVAVAAMSDLPKMQFSIGLRRGLSGPGVRSFRDDFGAGETLEARSPVHQAARADAPILLIHGEKDTVVPPAQSAAMAKALQAAGKPVEYLELKGEDHWLSKDDTRLAMLKAAVAFVEKHNPPD
jgi:dipeptidyl aminopeptidase/acylaminoacyl peptidase